jgi:two-component system, NtrC family, response regulator GlrR
VRRLFWISQPDHPVESLLPGVLGAGDGFLWECLRWDDARCQAAALSVSPLPAVELIVAASGAATGAAAQAVQLLERLTSLRHRVPTLAVMPAGSSDESLTQASAAADDFLVEPVHPAELRHRILRLVGRRREADPIATRLIAQLGPKQLIGESPAFLRVLEHLPKLAASGLPILVTGETGTGKEICARAIHQLSARRTRPFVAADCSVIPSHLFENEMFGHVRGAFTDARADQRGLIATAEGGTLFLDEIDALSPGTQAKLLRFLQERTYRPLGSDRARDANVNIIAATNRDLDAAIREQTFRADLYFRLNVLHLPLPALRERPSDIPLLAQHFLRDTLAQSQLGERAFSAAALRKLSSHHWPGNIRELANVVRRIAVFGDHTLILPGHFTLGDADGEQDGTGAEGDRGTFQQARKKAIAAFERAFIESVLRENDGNVTRAARAVNKDRRAFGRLMKKYGITRHAS